MIRNIGEAVLKNKKVLMLIDRLSFIVLLCGIGYIFYVARESSYSKIEENALSPHLYKLNSQHMIAYENYQQIAASMAEYKDQESVIQFLAKFFEENNMQYSIQNFSQKTENGIEQRQNIAGVYRAQRSINYECNLITFDINPVEQKVSIPFALAFAKYYESHKINYISRDVIFLGYDSRGKKYGYSVEQFIKDYLSESSILPKCGVIRQALNIDLENNFNSLYLKALGFDGKVPDRDYFLGFNSMFFDQFGQNFKYTEVSSKIPVIFGNFLERTLYEVGRHIDYPFPPSFFFNFKYFFHILIGGIYGDKHDAHSQLIYHGVQALTIKGKANPKKDAIPVMTEQLINVVDAAIRANFSLDEQLHAGSTLYYPITKQQQITIQKLPLGVILVSLPLAIQLIGIYLRVNDDSTVNTVKVYGRSAQAVLHALFMIALPTIAEKLYPLVFPNQGNPVFCQSWSSLSNPQLLNLFYLLVGLIVGTRLLMKIVIEFVILKGILKFSLKESKQDGDYSASFNAVILGLTCILYLFINTSISYFFLVIFCPMIYLSRPLVPRSIKDFARTVAILATLYMIYFIINEFQLNYLQEGIEAAITSQCVSSHKLWFAISMLFNIFWSLIEIFTI